MKKIYIFLIVIAVILISLRLYLPVFIRNQINNEINAMEEYSGGVERVGMQLIRGAVQLHHLVLYDESSSDQSEPFIRLDYLDVSVYWRALFRGEVVVEIIADNLDVNFTMVDDEIEEDPINLQELLEELIPFRIDLFRITNGRINLRDITSEPSIDLYLSDFFFEVTNIHNMQMLEDTLPASFRMEAIMMESGNILVDGGFNLLTEDVPDFEVTIELVDLDLIQLNEFFSARANFTIDQGLLNVYSESAARQGLMIGYVKPLIDDLEVLPVEEEDESTLRRMYESLLEAITNILESPETDMIGTRVDFEGRIDDPDVEVWNAAWLLLRNAFFESIREGLDHSIDFEQLQPN